jgi:hypothetical protein
MGRELRVGEAQNNEKEKSRGLTTPGLANIRKRANQSGASPCPPFLSQFV